MAATVGEFMLRRLHAWGVRRIYGYPGDGINGIIGAFRRVEELQLVQVRHEEMAAFMACAHAKFTGQVGVCLATSGPGAIHLLNSLYDAQMDHQPVVAIVGQQDRAAMGGRDLNQVTWEQRAMTGDPKLEASQDVPDFPYAGYAESLGLRGIRVDRPEQVGAAWDQAFASDRPVVVEAG